MKTLKVFYFACLFCVMPLFPLQKKDYTKKYSESTHNFMQFWEKEAQLIDWEQKFDDVWVSDTKGHPLLGKWFSNGKLNIAYNCVTRWAQKFPDAVALIWIGEEDTPDYCVHSTYTYGQLEKEISRAANMLKRLGIERGDKVCIWLPMVPQLVISQLACAKIGAVPTVIFAGYGIESIKNRIQDSNAKILITADQNVRNGIKKAMKSLADQVLQECNSVERVLVIKRTGISINMHPKRDAYWHEEMAISAPVCPNETMDSSDPLFILYSSGTTGKPKGIVHSCGGYLVYVMSTLKHGWGVKGFVNSSNQRDVWFCTADIGWITGHSYLTYGPLAFGAITIMHEGTPFYPDKDRFWDIVERFKVNYFYTSPTAIRYVAALNPELVNRHDLSSLKVLGTVGEPINVSAWKWFFNHVGKKKCPIIDTYWQTETGGVVMLPFLTTKNLEPGSCSHPFYGIVPKIFNEQGKEIEKPDQKGLLCITQPWPGMAQTLYNDHQRFFSTYLNRFKDVYFTGDYALKDEKGNFWIQGRADDVIKMSGHRLGTAEIENVLCSHHNVKEAAIIAKPHDIKGNSIVAFIVLNDQKKEKKEMQKELLNHVSQFFGPIGKPEYIIFCEDLPKTCSGKIVRRVLKALFLQKDWGDISTLNNKEILPKLQHQLKEQLLEK